MLISENDRAIIKWPMSETRYKTRRDYIFNLGFRRGANDRDAAGLPYSGNTPWPTVIPAIPAECSSEED